MDYASPPSSPHAVSSSCNLSEHDSGLEIEVSTEIQHLENYKPYLFRILLSPTPEDGMQTVKADVYYSTDQSRHQQHVALLAAKLIPRPNPNFYWCAEAEDEELGELACMFYNDNGKVSRLRNPDLVQIASRPGGFLWIDKVEVKPDHRGIDLGLQLLTETLKFLRNRWTLTVIQPQPFNLAALQWSQNASNHQSNTSHDLSVLKMRRHFSRLGFRQAGSDAQTSYAMFLSSVVFFPSTRKTLTWKTKEQVRNVVFPSPQRHIPKGLDMRLNDILCYRHMPFLSIPPKFPRPRSHVDAIERLLVAGASVHGSRALHIVSKYGADAALLRLLVNQGGKVNDPDESGNLPLHEAAREISPSIPHLIELGALPNVTNINNETPFDVLELAARVKQGGVYRFENVESNHRERAMENLRNAMIALIPEDLKLKLIDGCLAPRAHRMLAFVSLHCQTVIKNVTNKIYRNCDHLRLRDLRGYQLFLDYIPADVLTSNKDKFASSFFIGWKQVFDAILLCLDLEKVPTVNRIQRILDSHGKKCDVFFEAGGKIEFAIDVVICEARDAFRKDCMHWSSEIFPEDIDTLICTPLDDLFNVVQAICFEGCECLPGGPYQRSSEVMFDAQFMMN